jgi:hypothetical protein
VAKGTHFSLDNEFLKRTKKIFVDPFFILKKTFNSDFETFIVFYGTFDVVLRLVFWISKISIFILFLTKLEPLLI